MMNYPHVSIIILNWNGLAHTIRCLESIKKITYINKQIYVIDNGSNNNEAEILQKKFGGMASIITLSSNHGYAGGVNVGIKEACKKSTDYLVLLNNDTVVSQSFLEPLIELAEQDKRNGVVSPVIKDMNDTQKILYAGGKINWLLARPYHQYNEHNEAFETEFITGCCMVLKRDIINQVGFFDERFFAYFEDVAFCIQSKTHGYKLLCTPHSVIYHNESSSTGKKSLLYIYLFSRNRILFVKNYTNFIYQIYFFGFNLLKLSLVIFYFLLKRNGRLIPAYTKGYLDGYLTEGGTPRI